MSDGAGANAAALARAERREAQGLFLLCSPAVLLIAFVIFLPIGWLFTLSFTDEQGAFTLGHYARMLHPAYTRSFQTTLELSFLVTGICCLLGYPLAYLMSQVSKGWRAVIFVCVLFPFWTSLLVRTYAWLVLLQRRGMVNTWLQDVGLIDAPLRLVHNFTGTAIGMTQIMLPFMVLPLYAAMTSVDRDFVKAAASLGASPVKSFWQVFFPLTLPGLLAGVVLVFVLCLGFYVTPAVLGGGRVLMWSMSIERSVAVYSDWGAASALGVVLLVVTLGILWLMNRLFGVGRAIGGPVMADAVSGVPIGRGRRLWLYALGFLILLFLVLPTIIVIPMSFTGTRFLRFPPEQLSWRWYQAYLGSIEWREATWVSLKAAVLTMLVATPLGVMAAYGLHASRSKWSRLIETALIAPLILPLILVSIGIFFLYARLGLNNTMTGLVMAHVCLAMPFVFVTVLAGLKGYDMNQERVARSLGASRLVAFLTVTLPQVRFSVFSGALLAFITSLDEVVVALFISGGENATLTRRMFTALRDEIDPTVAAISSLLVALTLTLLALGLVFGDRRAGTR